MNLTIQEQKKIYMYLLGEFELGTPYQSPLPRSIRGSTDKNSSFNIYLSDSGRLVWKDFGGGGISGDAIDLIKILRGVHYGEAIKFYKDRIKNSRFTSTQRLKKSFHSRKLSRKHPPEPMYSRNLTASDLAYWESYGIGSMLLAVNRVYRAEGIDWRDSKAITRGSTEERPAFLYDLSEQGDMTSWKFYRPSLAKFEKSEWYSWNLSGIPAEGFYVVPKSGEHLIVASSRKDAMVLQSMGCRCVINVTGESAWRKLLPQVYNLNKRYGRVSVIFDGDDAGIKGSTKLVEHTDNTWENIKINYPKGTKDIAEIVEYYNQHTLTTILKQHNIIF